MAHDHPLTRSLIGETEKDHLFLHLIRSESLFALAKTWLKTELFDKGREAHYRALWKTLLDIVELRGPQFLFGDPAPARMVVEVKLKAYLESEPELVVGSAWNALFGGNQQTGLIEWAYNTSMQDLDEKSARQVLIEFLEERTIQLPFKRTLLDSGDAILVDLVKTLDDFKQRQQALSDLNSNPITSVAPEGWQPKPLIKMPTGVEWLDKFLNGGQAGGEVCGILGAYGSGKTTLACQMAVQSSFWHQSKQLLHPDHQPANSYIFHYEADDDEIKVKTWSHGAQVDFRVFEEWGLPETQFKPSTIGKLKPYELKKYEAQIKQVGAQYVLGEAERLEEATPRLRKGVFNIDMSGSPDNPNRGCGYVEEIAAILAQDKRRGCRIGCVVIDYVGIAVRRYLRKQTISNDEMRHYIGGFGDECRRLIAKPFNCPVWLFHQLSGMANRRGHATLAGHADAAEATNFAENLWFCFNLGTKHAESGVFQMSNSKSRRAKLGKPPLLRVDGFLSTVVEADEYTMLESGQIVSKAEADVFGPSKPSNKGHQAAAYVDPAMFG